MLIVLGCQTLAGCASTQHTSSGLIADLRVSKAQLGDYSVTEIQSVPTPWANGDLEGDGSTATVYDTHTAHSGWPAPYSWSNKAIAMTSVADGHTDKARVQLQSQSFPLGTELYIGFAFYVPSNAADQLPQYANNNGTYLDVAQIYGEPYGDISPVSLQLRRIGTAINLVASHPSESDPTSVMWQQLIALDQWIGVTLHVRLSIHAGTASEDGLLELWLNGMKQRFQTLPAMTTYYSTEGQFLSADGTTAYIATANTDTTSGESFYLDNYRSAINPTFTVPKSVTIFQAGAKIGTSYATVAP